MNELGWKAALDLSFVRDGARTALQERRHSGPLRVQRPFYPEGPGVCHVYVLHPPGGLVAGDTLHITASIAPGAHALLTTPAAGKLYRSRAPDLFGVQRQSLRVGAGARLEWLPQETIAFRGARAHLGTEIALREDASFLGWEILCLGRPAAQEVFDEGCLRPRVELTRDDKLVYSERALFEAGSPLMQAPWGLGGQVVVATMLCAAKGAETLIELARSCFSHVGHAQDAANGGVPQRSVSAWEDLLVARYLGPSVEEARIGLSALWSALRPAILGRDAVPPRIWYT